MNCLQKFEEIYKRSPETVAFCPYRVCPIGAHSDHQLGKVSGFAIDKGVNFAYSTKFNGVVELASIQFDKRAQWHVKAVPENRQKDWADYMRGATAELASRYPLQYGVSGVFEGSLPIGGLSSSAAVTLVFLAALCKVNSIAVSRQELVDIAMRAEFFYVGVSVGKLDQSCEVYSQAGKLLYLDTLDDSYELITAPTTAKPWKIGIYVSGLEHNLVSSKYNMRVDEVRSAAYALMAYSGMEYGKFNETYLRNVPFDVFQQYKDRLPENWRKRAEHWYSEFERVKLGAEAWRRGDIEEFGKLSTQSGYSSIYSWETGSDELKTLYELIVSQDGVYGGRFSGAGFKGCCIALIDPSFEESIERNVRKGFLHAFPELSDKYQYCGCNSVDGIQL